MEEQAKLWQERIERQQASGQGMAAWCAEQGLNRKTMWAWRRRLAAAPLKRRRRRGLEARRHWERLMRLQAGSGLSVAGFCRKRGLCAPHFFEWKRKLAEAEPAAPAEFIPVEVVAPRTHQAIELVLGGGRLLRLEPGFDRGHLQAILEALERGQ